MENAEKPNETWRGGRNLNLKGVSQSVSGTRQECNSVLTTLKEQRPLPDCSFLSSLYLATPLYLYTHVAGRSRRRRGE